MAKRKDGDTPNAPAKQPRGAGHIQRRGNSIRFVVWDPIARHHKYETLPAAEAAAMDDAAVQRALAKFTTDVIGDNDDKAKGRMTVAAKMRKYLDTRTFRSPKTRDQYEWAWRGHIKPKIGQVYLRKLDTATIERFIADLTEHLAPRSVRHVYAALHVFLQSCVRRGMLRTNPASAAENVPEVNERTVTAPTRAQVNTFLKAAGARSPEWHALAVTFVGSGCRRGELAALRWDDLDLDVPSGLLRVDEEAIDIEARHDPDTGDILEKGHKDLKDAPKTPGSVRRLVLDPGVTEVLRQHRGRREDELKRLKLEWDERAFVFSPDSAGDDYFSPHTLTTTFREIAGTTDLRPGAVRPHKLRHFSATEAAKAGVPIFEVMGRHGWRNQQTASKYQHYADAHDHASASAAVAHLNLGIEKPEGVASLDEHRRSRDRKTS